MRKAVFLWLALLVLSGFSQTVPSTVVGNPVAINGVGQPLAGITVAICSSNPGANPSVLCTSSLVETYTDITLIDGACGLNSSTLTLLYGPGCTNPGLTDGQGNIIAYATAGTYWCEYQAPQFNAIKVIPCIFPGLGSATQAAGSDTQIQFNQAGSFGASANLTFNYSTNTLTVGPVSSNYGGVTCQAGPLTPTSGACLTLGAIAASGTSLNSQTVSFNSVNGSGTPENSTLFEDSTGFMNISDAASFGSIDNSARLPTTAYLKTYYAPLASPALTGAPTAPTPTAGDNSTKLATTAFVSSAATTGANTNALVSQVTVGRLATLHIFALPVASGQEYAFNCTLVIAGGGVYVTKVFPNLSGVDSYNLMVSEARCYTNNTGTSADSGPISGLNACNSSTGTLDVEAQFTGIFSTTVNENFEVDMTTCSSTGCSGLMTALSQCQVYPSTGGSSH